jgi:hypothetical protein
MFTPSTPRLSEAYRVERLVCARNPLAARTSTDVTNSPRAIFADQFERSSCGTTSMSTGFRSTTCALCFRASLIALSRTDRADRFGDEFDVRRVVPQQPPTNFAPD